MTSKRACLVFVPEVESVAQMIATLLHEQGLEVCLVEIEVAETEAIEAGDYDGNAAVRACVDGADLCLFLLGGKITGSVNAAAAIVAGSKNRIVVVTQGQADLPQVFDDAADAVVSSASPELRDVVLGKDVWQKPDGSAAPRRVPARVKCQ